MFGRSKPVLFKPHRRRGTRWRPPRWLVLLLVGAALGAGSVVVVQERYLPPRLSADASADLRSDFEAADAQRRQLKTQLDETARRLEIAIADKKGLTDEVAASHATALRLQDEVAAIVASLPPDPRGGAVEVRAGRFAAQGATLAYDVVLTRPRSAGKPIAAVMQLVVAGAAARGTETTVTLKPVALSIGTHEIVRGTLPLPEGFRPRQTTIQVLDRVAGKSLGMRVMLVP